MDETNWRDIANHWSKRAAAERDRFEQARLLMEALADESDFKAVAKVFPLKPDTRVISNFIDPDLLEAAIAPIGRAIRKIIAEGGPDITDPGRALHSLIGRGPLDFPRFHAGEPLPRPRYDSPAVINNGAVLLRDA